MDVILFKITGKIKAVNQKKVEPEEILKEPSCFVGFPLPYEVGEEY
jgi:hypothetical protein